jgi:hypothetical protein
MPHFESMCCYRRAWILVDFVFVDFWTMSVDPKQEDPMPLINLPGD